MRVLVVGASGGTGREAVRALLAAGHEVTAMARSADRLEAAPGLTRRRGDALREGDVEAAVPGHDAVLVTLGIAESPIKVRLGLGATPVDVRSRGTANVVAAMQRHGVRRLVVQTTYGVGPSAGRLSLAWSLMFTVLLRPQIDDTERQEALVRASGLDWTLVQPVGLVERDTGRATFTSTSSEVRTTSVSRGQVASVLGALLFDGSSHGATVAVSS